MLDNQNKSTFTIYDCDGHRITTDDLDKFIIEEWLYRKRVENRHYLIEPQWETSAARPTILGAFYHLRELLSGKNMDTTEVNERIIEEENKIFFRPELFKEVKRKHIKNKGESK